MLLTQLLLRVYNFGIPSHLRRYLLVHLWRLFPFLNHHWFQQHQQHHGNELHRLGPGGQLPSALDVRMLRMLGLSHPHPIILMCLSLRLAPLFLRLAQLPTNILHLWRLPQFFRRTGRIPRLPLMSGFV
jgi:hypothetical protein